ncbi:DegV family protein [Saccharibacillus sp. CPCC 101409]|uniref:DegV family protein n=1 Tax=Saccharibacillus sp. CPCC 101409 TaxID=3058041 RepID=UPI002673DF47|nr:DegV family protein [Saccharibacillus sp. CPCC 101409]MDO3410809.1 DegV family protein [Saccharibacillus sp. CPCC 101409]
MRRIKVVTDSTVDLNETILREHGIEIVPLTFTIDGQTYTDGVDFTPESFIQKMIHAAELPKSSQPSVGAFVEMYDRLGGEGFDVLSIHMTGGMSGTVRSAAMAAEMTDTNVTVVDSKYITKGLAFQVLEAVQMAERGCAMEEILARLDEVRNATQLYVVVDTLENLVKGGRIGRGKALIGSLLHIKPIGTLKDGELNIVNNARSHAQVVKQLSKQFAEDVKGRTVKGVGLVHAEGCKLAESLKSKIHELTGYSQIEIEYTTPVISTHTGVGAIGFTYYCE